MEYLADTYGPYAFGCVAVIVLWRVIVIPIMKMREKEMEARQTMSQTLLTTAEGLKEASETNKAAAETNKEVTQELRAVVADLKSMPTHHAPYQIPPNPVGFSQKPSERP